MASETSHSQSLLLGAVKLALFGTPFALVLALAAVGCSASSDAGTRTSAQEPIDMTAAAGHSPTAASIDPDQFVDRIDNRYFPLEVGTVYQLRGKTDEGVETETITVTPRTKEIQGVTTTVIRDVVRLNGEFHEYTEDWYAQDRAGNVWYFGEETAEYENGKVVNRHGSWEAGVDGARPGIIMNADPQVTDSYRQEFYAGEAEDMYWVVATGETASTSYGDFHDVVRTLEWNPLEPKIVGEKLYAPGIGIIGERALSGGLEAFELVDITHR